MHTYSPEFLWTADMDCNTSSLACVMTVIWRSKEGIVCPVYGSRSPCMHKLGQDRLYLLDRSHVLSCMYGHSVGLPYMGTIWLH